MEPVDKLLSLDMSPDDCYYRFRRDFEHTSTVVYVHVQDLAIIPEDKQTYGPDVIKVLKGKVDVWNQHWTTLTVFQRDSKILCLQDSWVPHFLPSTVISRNVPRVNVLDLQVIERLKHRVSLTSHGLRGGQQILKICPFEYELKYMTREVTAYDILRRRGCALIPNITAYVYERTEEQVIGFICEELEGDPAGPDDYEECKRSLQKFHSYGVLHGDLNRYNIIITTAGPRFIDLENATLDTDKSLSKQDFLRLQEEELEGLEKALCEPEGWGRPWL